MLARQKTNGAVEWIRTTTVLLPPAPQAGASASSATTALRKINKLRGLGGARFAFGAGLVPVELREIGHFLLPRSLWRYAEMFAYFPAPRLALQLRNPLESSE
jgi:hypothetical protein